MGPSIFPITSILRFVKRQSAQRARRISSLMVMLVQAYFVDILCWRDGRITSVHNSPRVGAGFVGITASAHGDVRAQMAFLSPLFRAESELCHRCTLNHPGALTQLLLQRLVKTPACGDTLMNGPVLVWIQLIAPYSLFDCPSDALHFSPFHADTARVAVMAVGLFHDRAMPPRARTFS